jgi:hypothetical protein
MNPVIDPQGTKRWYKEGSITILHRLNGPAVVYANGNTSWYKDDLRHRLDGPALEWDNTKEWYVNGEHIKCSSQKEFEKLMKLKAFW